MSIPMISGLTGPEGGTESLSGAIETVQRLLDQAIEMLKPRSFGVAPEALAHLAPASWVARPRTQDNALAVHLPPSSDGVASALARLRQALRLDDLSYWIVVMALAPCFSHRVAQGFALLRHDPDSPHLSAGVILDLLGMDGMPGAEDIFAAVAPGTLLVDLGFVQVPASGIASMRDSIVPSPRLLEWARGATGLGIDVPPGTRLESSKRIEGLVLSESEGARVAELAADLASAWLRADLSLAPTIILSGPDGVGKGLVALHLAKAIDRPLLRVDLRLSKSDVAHATSSPDVRSLQVVRRAAREALLHRALLYIEGIESLDNALDFELAQLLHRHVDVFVLGSTTSLAGRRIVPSAGPVVHLRLTRPGPAERRVLWKRHLPRGFDPSEACLDTATHRYRVTGGQIQRASAVVADSCHRRELDRSSVHIIDEAIRVTVAHTLESVARRLPHPESVADLVTSKETELLLRVMSANYRHRRKVFDDWGFARRFPRGLGLSALFSGPPGTGKTMAAGVVAAELGLPLYQIELSQVVSKWVGETEKNLDRVFSEAEAASAVILFDEADSLFARRTDVSSANDRYANLEVNHLLQHIEAFEGICILTTNSLSAIDPAFMRRFAYQLTFPLPDAQERALLWERLIPAEADVARPIRFDVLARTFEFSGGHIKNAILRAAFFAVELGTPITEPLLQLTGSLEQKQLGVAVRHIDVAALWAGLHEKDAAP